jgi:hypothetical protein
LNKSREKGNSWINSVPSALTLPFGTPSIPARPFFLAAFRILSLPHPISCGYLLTYRRDLAAFLRRASDAMRDDMRVDPAHPARPLAKNAKKAPKKDPKGAENAAKIDKN